MRKRALTITVLALATAACGVSVSEKEHCIETRYDKVINKKMTPGWNWQFTTAAECFDLREKNYPEAEGEKEVVEVITGDSIKVTLDLAGTWAQEPGTVYQVYLDKGNQESVKVELLNALRDGARTAATKWVVADFMGPKRATMGEDIAAAANKKLGNIASFKKVYVRGAELPGKISEQQLLKATALSRQETERATYVADSLAERKNLYKEQVAAEIKRLQGEALQKSPALQAQELERIRAQGMANIFKSCTANCILGGSVADKFMSGSK